MGRPRGPLGGVKFLNAKRLFFLLPRMMVSVISNESPTWNAAIVDLGSNGGMLKI